MEDLLILFGQRLRDLRKTAKLSQGELAEKSGLHLNTISDIEQGKTNPSLVVCKAIADGLGVSLFDLFNFTELSGGLNPEVQLKLSELIDVVGGLDELKQLGFIEAMLMFIRKIEGD